MKNLAVFCSGFGSNLQAIITAVKKKKIKANISLVVCDRVDAFALVRAKKAGINIYVSEPENFKDKLSYERGIVRVLKKHKIDFIILAGFMRILSAYFIRQYKNKIVNIHPALLPSFKGKAAIKDALDYGVKITGVTVHFVDEKIDAGPIILQRAIAVRDDDREDTLAKRVHKLEHTLYPQTIEYLVRNKILLKGRKVRVNK
ncbi:MAG: phosphoribosylglycinamide formyltransferase [Candidatus Omnitrophica bacterium]|nr:phosphoribosylglycinamide formyltransferase [Candidatus Omnitrophota bacterium]